MGERSTTIMCFAVFLFICGCVLSIQSCTTVDAGYVGVKRTFGEVSEDPLKPGLHFIMPFFIDSVTEIETRLKSYEVQASAASKDLQIVTTVISVQHSLNGDLAPESFAAIGSLENFDTSIIDPAVLESLKAVTAQYTAEELITKRDTVKLQVSDAIQAFINQTLEERGVGGALHIANVAIKDFNFSEEFNNAIESKVQAQQQALRAQNEKVKRITEAEAAAEEKKLEADAEAYQIEKMSLQRAEAIKREAAALAENPSLLQLRAVEKWSGTLPTFVGGGNAIPFIDASQFSTERQGAILRPTNLLPVTPNQMQP